MARKVSMKSSPVSLPTIAIVGRPNVGKSSLFNVIVGRRLSIVHEMSGVTRDRVVEPVSRRNRRFQLIDTGGLGTLYGESRNVDVWDERIGEQVAAAIEGADVLICVGNVQEGVVPLDEEVARRLRQSGKPVLYAVNKCDNPSLTEESMEFSRLGFESLFPVSCMHRSNIESLVDAAVALLPAGEEEAAEAAEAAKPFSIAVIGRPNVGKSSLVNALLGEERVIVSEVAGTTRDAIDIDFTLQFQDSERPAVLVDTAGLRKQTKVDTVVEYFSVMRAKSAISRADLVLFVVESDPTGMTAQDRKIASMIQGEGKACVIVANKYDLYRETYKPAALASELRHTLPGMDYAPVVFISARDKRNLGGLLDQIGDVMANLEMKVPTSVVNRVLADAFAQSSPPVVGSSPLKLYYASMIGNAPPKFLLFVNEPKYCAPNYLAFLRNTLRQAFDLTGLPILLELRARPKKVEGFHTPGPARNSGRPKKR